MNNKILLLHSDKSNNNKFILDKRIEGYYQFKSFVATNNIYNVTNDNNQVYVNENGTDYTITLTNGYYDSSDLTTEFQDKLNSTLSGTVSITLDDNTNKFTITNTLPFYFTFGSNTTNSARKLLGFNANDPLIFVTTQTSDNPIDLNPCKNVFISITEDDNRNVEGIDFFNCSLIVNGTNEFGGLMRYVDVDNFVQVVKFKNTKQLTVSFHDANNNSIDLNSEYQIIFVKL